MARLALLEVKNPFETNNGRDQLVVLFYATRTEWNNNTAEIGRLSTSTAHHRHDHSSLGGRLAELFKCC